MPTYLFYDTVTKEEFEEFMSISDKETYLKGNPHINQRIQPPNFIKRRDGDVLKKAGAGWNEVLQKIGSHHPGSDVAKTNIRRSAKEVKTADIIKKHVDLQVKDK